MVAEKKLDSLGVTELTLSNGVTVVLKPTDFKDDEILMAAMSPGGHSLYDLDTYYSAVNADGIVQQSGVKDLSRMSLEAATCRTKRPRLLLIFPSFRKAFREVRLPKI